MKNLCPIIFLLSIIIVFAGCDAVTSNGSNHKETPLKLIGTNWQLEVIKYENSNVTIAKNDPLAINFQLDSTIEGSGGGNTFYGAYSYSQDDKTIDIKPKGMTFAGINPSNSKILLFMESLEEAETYSINNKTLEIIFNGQNSLIFSQKNDSKD